MTTSPTVTSTAVPLVITPTGTDSATSLWLQTSIIIEQSSTALLTGVPTSSAPTGIPSALPKVITPGTAASPAPADSQLIQIGFNYELNYGFVVSHSMASRQIFSYLPQGIADGLGISVENVIMNSLVPYDTQAQLGYITTLALLYIPQSMVSTLALDIHIPTSQLYNDPDPSVNTMMRYINSAIPITAGSTLASGGSGGASTGAGNSDDSSSNPAANNNGGVFNDNTQQTTSSSTSLLLLVLP